MNIFELQKINKSCTKCNLCKQDYHVQVVPGDGPQNAKLMVIAEAPGQDENLIGIPLVGRAGQLFNKILEASKIDRKEIYISNVVKCRPPNNRPPNEEELTKCKSWLWKEIQIIQPIYIVTLGSTSSHLLLKCNLPMSKLLGKEYRVDYCNSLIIPCYHPSYLLRRGGSNQVVQPCIDIFVKIKEQLCKENLK